jgi:hypothetical protein
MSDLKALATIDFSGEEWDQIYHDQPDIADAIRYLLLIEKHGAGIDNSRLSAETSAMVAFELSCSLTKLAMLRRKWTESHALEKARAFLAPLRQEQDMLLADMVLDAKAEIITNILNKAKDKNASVYAIISAMQYLESQVVKPAREKLQPADNRDTEYLEKSQSYDVDNYIKQIEE